MLLKNIHIKHFRGIEELRLPLDDMCVLIGENNSRKSTTLDAIRV
jgi:putative ATP-dependent endonuclease of OLD family